MSVAGSARLIDKDEARAGTGSAKVSVALAERLGKDQERVSVGDGRVMFSSLVVALMMVLEVLLGKPSSSEWATKMSTVILFGCVFRTVCDIEVASQGKI
jgi:hypothetical protein